MNSPEAPCRKAVSTVDASQCFDLASKAVDRKLNLTYQQIHAVLQADDQQKLLTAQRLWLQFRDAACVAERSLYGQGTGGSPAYLACLKEVTRQRAADLETIYGWVVKKFSH